MALVVGGSGALGRAVVKTFLSSWTVGSLDFNKNDSANFNYLLEPG